MQKEETSRRFKVAYHNFSGGIKENLGTRQSGWSLLGLSFEL